MLPAVLLLPVAHAMAGAYMQPFLDTILPVFAVVGVGFLCARLGFLDRDVAAMLNRFVFYVGVPPLLFRLVVTAPFAQFDPLLVGLFVTLELTIYGLGIIIARFALRLDWRSSVLTGFTACFVNHVFLVLPITVFLFGEDAALPIVALITVDAFLILAGTALVLDVLSGARDGGSPVLKVVKATATNTQVLAILAGFGFVLSGLPFYTGLDTFTGFLAGAAGPAALVALGIILQRPAGPGDVRVPLLITGLKLVVHPALAFGAVALVGLSITAAQPALMVAAGPSGAMALILATRYGLLVDEVARAILITTVLSLGTVTAVALL
ncbi:MAG: AEC family transporter [Pseudomonadota bacterium]